MTEWVFRLPERFKFILRIKKLPRTALCKTLRFALGNTVVRGFAANDCLSARNDGFPAREVPTPAREVLSGSLKLFFNFYFYIATP